MSPTRGGDVRSRSRGGRWGGIRLEVHLEALEVAHVVREEGYKESVNSEHITGFLRQPLDTFTFVSSENAPLLVSWMTDRIGRDHLVPAAGVGIGPAQLLQDAGVGVGSPVDC